MSSYSVHYSAAQALEVAMSFRRQYSQEDVWRELLQTVESCVADDWGAMTGLQLDTPRKKSF